MQGLEGIARQATFSQTGVRGRDTGQNYYIMPFYDLTRSGSALQDPPEMVRWNARNPLLGG